MRWGEGEGERIREEGGKKEKGGKRREMEGGKKDD